MKRIGSGLRLAPFNCLACPATLDNQRRQGFASLNRRASRARFQNTSFCWACRRSRRIPPLSSLLSAPLAQNFSTFLEKRCFFSPCAGRAGQSGRPCLRKFRHSNGFEKGAWKNKSSRADPSAAEKRGYERGGGPVKSYPPSNCRAVCGTKLAWARTAVPELMSICVRVN